MGPEKEELKMLRKKTDLLLEAIDTSEYDIRVDDVKDLVLKLHVCQKELETQNRELQKNQLQLRRELCEKETLLQEIHHRVKNNLNVIASLLALQTETIETTEEAKRALSDSRNRAYYMAQVHEQLYRSHSLSHIDMESYLKTVVGDLAGIYDAKAKRVAIDFEMGSVEMSVSAAVPLGLLVNELVTNSLTYAFPMKVCSGVGSPCLCKEMQHVGGEPALQQGKHSGEKPGLSVGLHGEGNPGLSESGSGDGHGLSESPSGRITVSLSELPPDEYEITVKDNGIGLPEDFTPEETESFGWHLITALCEQLNGKLQISGTDGTSVSIRFPKHN
jgi:two-component sensor histidine kinase